MQVSLVIIMNKVYSFIMNRKSNPFLAVIATVVFAASMLSNCYCAPLSETTPQQESMATHCKHHASPQEKSSDCAPRFHTDNFENATISAKAIQPPSMSDLVPTKGVSLISEKAFEFDVPFESPPVSPPEFFVLQHAFLI